MSVIALDSVSFCYESQSIFHNVSLEIFPLECAVLFGPNGGGKTTLLQLILGLLTPTSGRVRVMGKSPAESYPKIGYVPQNHRVDKRFPISVREVVQMGLLSTFRWGFFPRSHQKTVDQALDRVGLLAFKDHPFSQLSGGQTQRALIARAIVGRPAVLLLDEPTASIDPSGEKLLCDLFLSLKSETTLVVVTHDLQTLAPLADRAFAIHHRITPYQVRDLCAHFSLGLYHLPEGSS